MNERLAQHLITRKLLPESVVVEALKRLDGSMVSFDTVLLETGKISEQGVLQALADVSGVKLVNLRDFEPNVDAAQFVPLKIVHRLNAVPLSVDGRSLHIASCFPVQKDQLKEVGFLLGYTIEPWVALECRVRDWQHSLYRDPIDRRHLSLLAKLEPTRNSPAAKEAARPGASDGGSTVGRITPRREQVIVLAKKKTKTQEMPGIVALAQQVEAGEKTVVVDSKAYASYANPSQPGLPNEEQTRILDAGAYGQFARSVTSPAEHTKPTRPDGPQARGASEAESTTTEEWRVPISAATIEPTVGVAFPGGVLPPPSRPRPETPASAAARSARNDLWMTPAPAPKPSADSMVPFFAPKDAAVALAAPLPLPSAPPAPRPTDETIRALPGNERVVGLEPLKPDAAAPEKVGDETLRGSPEKAPEPPPTPMMSPPFDIDVAPPISAPSAPAAPVVPDPDLTVPTALPAPEVTGPAAPGEWTLEEARAHLSTYAYDRDAVVDIVLTFGQRSFDFVALFAVVRGVAYGWDGRGDGDLRQLRQLAIPLDASSVFRTVANSRANYVGPVPADLYTQHYLKELGRNPRTIFLFPVEVQGRTVAFVYGDCERRPMSQRRLSDFALFSQNLSDAFTTLILYRRENASSTWSEGPGQEVPTGENPAPAETERLIKLLDAVIGADGTARALALSQLEAMPQLAAPALASAFVGPTTWSRGPVVEKPEPEELGPVPGALARMGPFGAAALAPLLDVDDADTRYFALLTAGSLPFADVVPGILRGLFDLEPDISSAARAAAVALKFSPDFQAALPTVREELLSRDPLRRSLAARALGALHDKASIERLIALTESEDELCASSAANALYEITRVSLGVVPRGWQTWWNHAQGRRRVEWLVDALESDDVDIRLASIEELTRAFHDNRGFFVDGSPNERAAAVNLWRQYVTSRPDIEL